MWRNYLLTGFRALAKNRTYSLINLMGLAIGMAACLMIVTYIRYETSYDRWLPDAERIYQLQTWQPDPSDNRPFFTQMAPHVSRAALEKDFPEVERSVYGLSGEPTVIRNGEVSPSRDYIVVNDDFLAVFDLPILHGSRDALNAPATAVLTRSEAIRRFGTDRVVGRTITLIQRGVTYDYRIRAVLHDLPRNSHLRINGLFRRDLVALYAEQPDFLRSWGWKGGWVWARLKPGSDVAAMMARMPAWEKRNVTDEVSGDARFNAGDDQDWRLVNVADVHLGRAQMGEMTPGNDRRSLVTFGIVAALILGMAVVNFTNLATARASARAREVALRKVLGATRRQLVAQFVGEAMLLSLLAAAVGLALVELAVRPFAAFLDADLAIDYWGAHSVLPPAIALTLIVGVLGGLYPALFLSRFQPAAVLKANRSAAETPGTGRLRNALVVTQFAISIALIICTVIVYAQTVYVQTVDPGYRRDHILQVDNLSRLQIVGRGEAIVDRMRRIPGVEAVGRGDVGVAPRNDSSMNLRTPGSARGVVIDTYRVDTGYREAMGMRLIAGRWFDRARPADDMTLPIPAQPEPERALIARGANIVVNELAARRLGAATPQDILGKTFLLPISDRFGELAVTVIGVVGDARLRSARRPVDPTLFMNVRSGPDVMVIRYSGNPVTIREAVRRVWQQAAATVPFEAQFGEERIAELYNAERKRARIFAGFAQLAEIIACLGLFGLATFAAERRTKEIGVRKVLGARTWDIVRLLVWQFAKPVLVANLIAWPVAWWLMRDWLNGFDIRMNLTPLPFLVAGGVALAIAVATVSGHALRIARSNPIRALRYE